MSSVPAALGDQSQRGTTDELLIVEPFAPAQRPHVSVFVIRFIVHTPQPFAHRRSDIRVRGIRFVCCIDAPRASRPNTRRPL
jgi:hypothetical protein